MSAAVDVLVVGGGVAGISAAVHLAEAGQHVMLLEQRKLLGGRAGSFEHPLGARGLLDSSPHVLLGCCTELQDLYRRLGVSHLIRFERTLEFADSAGRRARLRPMGLPAPLHLGPSMTLFNLLDVSQRVEIVGGMACMYLAGESGRNRQEGRSFREYLRAIGQSDYAIRNFWDVVAVSALNETCAEVSAKYGMQVFQEAFLGGRHHCWLGYASSSLSELYQQLPGVEVRTGANVRGLAVEKGRVTGALLGGGERICAREVVLATGPRAALALLRPIIHLDPAFAGIEKLQFRPIMGVHLLYDRPAPIDHAVALLHTRLHWVFPDTRRPELVHGVVSAADLLTDPLAVLPGVFDSEIKAALPEFSDRRLVDHLVVRERRATFRPLPGVDGIRPTQATQVPGLTLAGDYTRTDWPATMEGAARSGRRAAEVIMSRGRR